MFKPNKYSLDEDCLTFFLFMFWHYLGNKCFSQACQRQFDVYMLFGLEQWIRVCHSFQFDADAHTGYMGGSIVIIKSLSADNIYVCISQSRNKES